MKPRVSSLAIPVLTGLSLFFAACGGDSDAPEATATPGTSSAASETVASSTTVATGTGESATSDPATVTSGSETPGATSGADSTPTPEATPAPTQDPERVKAFTNGILGEAQEPLFWMQLITGDIECGTNCPDSLDSRWSRTLTICGQGRWESRKTEDGYNEAIHGPLVNALIESCGMLSAKYSSGGTPDDSDEWREVANGAINVLGPQFQELLESSLAAE